MSHEDVRRHAPVSRPKTKPRETEIAEGELKLGEFQNVPCLSMSEAALLVKAILDRRTRRGVDRVWSEYVAVNPFPTDEILQNTNVQNFP